MGDYKVLWKMLVSLENKQTKENIKEFRSKQKRPIKVSYEDVPKTKHLSFERTVD